MTAISKKENNPVDVGKIIEDHEVRLQKRLDEKGLRLKKVPGGGNCFFHTLISHVRPDAKQSVHVMT